MDSELGAILTGGQEVPPVATEGAGSASVKIDFDDSGDELEVELDVAGLSGITAAHIHAGATGVDGPVIFTLSSGGFTDELEAKLDAGDLEPAPAQGINTMTDALSAILCGNTYLNVHTINHPDGELRGQIGGS